MSAQHTLDKILEKKIIAIVRCIPAQSMLRLVQSLLDGGISCIEVTFDHRSPQGIENTIASIETLRRQLGEEVVLGAGTVLTAEQAQMACDAGAQYILAPNTDECVIKKSKALGLVAIPGAMTPTEAANAWAWGADIVKLFPAAVLGPSYIRDIKAPLAHLRFSAVGGINKENMGEFLAAGACCVGVGGSLVNAGKIAQGDFAAITEQARCYTQQLAQYSCIDSKQ